MDIGQDLFYNENTARSGDLLKGEKPGRETMQRKKEYKEERKQTKRIALIGLVFPVLLLLSGCTKKEELLLLDGECTALEEDISEAAGETASSEAGSEEETAEPESISVSEPELLWVHVCGAVMRPGVYELPAGCRVYEAVQTAGGFTEDADQNYVNQAQTLRDGVKLVIPTKEEVMSFQSTGDGNAGMTAGIIEGSASDGQESGTGETKDGRININTATESELCNIPGIGETRAAAIAAYRESHGSFKTPEDIMNVTGIKEGTYEKIKDSIRVN